MYFFQHTFVRAVNMCFLYPNRNTWIPTANDAVPHNRLHDDVIHASTAKDTVVLQLAMLYPNSQRCCIPTASDTVSQQLTILYPYS